MPPSSDNAIASAITDATTGALPKPRARNVPIYAVREETAEYMVLSAPNRAPKAMI